MTTRRGRVLLVGCGLAACLLATAAMTGGPAAAQTTAPTTTTGPGQSATGTSVRGTLAADGKPVEGARITVRRGRSLVGQDTSDRHGDWVIDVPGPGNYQVALDPTTLPKGIRLADPRRAVLPNFTVFGGLSQQRVLFPLLSGKEKAASAPSPAEVHHPIPLNSPTHTDTRSTPWPNPTFRTVMLSLMPALFRAMDP